MSIFFADGKKKKLVSHRRDFQPEEDLPSHGFRRDGAEHVQNGRRKGAARSTLLRLSAPAPGALSLDSQLSVGSR